jgi:hypothetical protein
MYNQKIEEKKKKRGVSRPHHHQHPPSGGKEEPSHTWKYTITRSSVLLVAHILYR